MARTSKHRLIYRALAALAALALPLGVAAAQAAPRAAAVKAKPKGTVISVENTVFGPALVVGSGPFKGFSLDFLSWDKPPVYGCTTGVTKTPVGPITCTGPSNDKNAEWPAITTNGRPVAGRGVSRKLLGTVKRKGVGTQITYACYLLYLFDQMPGTVTGEGWFEPGLPPWFGIWWLMSPGGYPVPWAGTLTTTKVGGKTVLGGAADDRGRLGQLPGLHVQRRLGLLQRLLGEGGLRSRVAADHHRRRCRLARGAPLQIGELGVPGNLTQVSWAGQPLYLFSHEQLGLGPGGMPVAQGNGNGIKAFGGTFSLVVNP